MFRTCFTRLFRLRIPQLKVRVGEPLVTRMSQKSITSFFSSKASNGSSPTSKSPQILKEIPRTSNTKTNGKRVSERPEEQMEATVSEVKKVRISGEVVELGPPSSVNLTEEASPDTSPIKPGKRRRVQILESDEEEESDSENVTIPPPKSSPSESEDTPLSTPPATGSIPKRKTAKLSKEFTSRLANRVHTPHPGKVRSLIEDQDSPDEGEESPPTATSVPRPSPIASRLASFNYKKRGLSSQKNVDDCKTSVPESTQNEETRGLSKIPPEKTTSPRKSDSGSGTPVSEKSTPKSGTKKPLKKSPKNSPPAKKGTATNKVPDTKSVELVNACGEGGYNPRGDKYRPISDACWKSGQDVPYNALADTLKAIEETSARLQKTHILSNFLRSVSILSPDDLHLCVYLCTNQVAPAYEGIELGVGETVVMKAIHEACGVNIAAQKAKLADLADLGLVAEASRAKQKLMFKPKPLSVRGVFQTLIDMTAISGNQGQGQKVALIKKLLVSCQGSEARFITRSMLGKLRCGLAEQTVLVALGHAVVQTPPGGGVEDAVASGNLAAEKDMAADIVKTCYCEFPNFEHIIKMIREHGVRDCQEHCKLSPGVPVKPMLAHPTKGISEVLQRFEGCEFSCEFKYDGERAQVQCSETGEMRIFSRNQENNTTKYPDIIARMGTCLAEGTTSFILDCEVVAWDVEEKKILPFQILTTRKRKDADVNEIKVKVCLFAFDLLYLNGDSLIRTPFRDRRRNLHSAFKEVEGEFVFASARDCTDTEEIQEFLDESIKNQCEGLMVKTLDKDATYEIAKRSHNWLKVKKDYLEGCGDSLDLAVIGAFRGKGKRTGAFGGFLLACYDPDTEQFQAICKLGTGLTDEDLASQTKALSEHIIDTPKSYYSYPESHTPEVWFEPCSVWEVKCADMTISPVYMAAMGLVDPDKGISLRFPRFIRVREDKAAEEATSADQVAELYQKQDNKQEQAVKVEEDDY